MPFFDFSGTVLRNYQGELHTPADLDYFWQQSLSETRAYALDPDFVPYESGLKQLEVYDVSFSGYGGQRIKAWYLRPANTSEKLPCIVEYIGYGGGRGFPHNWLLWPSAGYAFLVMDTRGQGSTWRRGDTPDFPDGANPALPGYMTQGITDPHHYYYRRLYMDAVRAVETVHTRADVDTNKIIVTGGSQGGGLSLAAAALIPEAVSLCMPDVPFLCYFRRAVGLTDDFPYQEIVQYLSIHREKIDLVFNTLDYFDNLHLAHRIQAHCVFSVALMDTICPPSTVYATYNQINSPKQIYEYTFNGHEGGADTHQQIKLNFVNQFLGF